MVEAPAASVHPTRPTAPGSVLEGLAWRAVVALAATGSAAAGAHGIREALPDGGWLAASLTGLAMALVAAVALAAVAFALWWAFRLVGLAGGPFVPPAALAGVRRVGSRFVHSPTATAASAVAAGALVALLAVGIDSGGSGGADRSAGSETSRGGRPSTWSISAGTSPDAGGRDGGTWGLGGSEAEPPPGQRGGLVVPGDGADAPGGDEPATEPGDGDSGGDSDGDSGDSGGDSGGDGEGDVEGPGDGPDPGPVEETCETLDDAEEDATAGTDGTVDDTTDGACDTLEGAEEGTGDAPDDDEDSLVGGVLEGLLGDGSTGGGDTSTTTTTDVTTTTVGTGLL